MRLYINFKTHDFMRYIGALSRIETTLPKTADDMCRYGAIDYKTEVTVVIATQNFVTRVPKLKKKYLEWKVEHGFPQRIGILKYDLLNNIKAIKVQDGWFGGVDPNARDSGGKNWSLRGPSNLVAKYAVWLEEGNRLGKPDQQRPRRIFMPIAKRYAKTGYIKRVEQARDRMARQWR
jgi:hypothetical protein